MSQTVTYQLPDSAYETYTWVLQDEHAPASQSPLIASSNMFGGFMRGGDNDIPVSLTINGYNYSRVQMEREAAALFGRMKPPESAEELTSWRNEWQAPMEKLANALEAFDPETVPAGKWAETLASQEKEFGQVFMGVHRTAVMPARMAASRFLDAYVQRFGESRRKDAMSCLQGFPNRSLDRATALWELGRILRANPELRTALDRRQPLTNTPAGRRFKEKFEAMLQEFGFTTDNGMQDLPTWREGSPIPLAVIRAYSKQDDSKSPQEAARQQAERRHALEQELREGAATDPSLAELVRLMELAQHLLPNLEDHNLQCDQRMAAASRARWLSIGRHLQKKGALTAPDDVFYYRRDELLRVLEGGTPLPLEEVSQRREMQELFRSTPPPLFLGKPPEAPQPVDEIPEEAIQGRTLKGIPASPGSYRGRAKVIEAFSEAGKLEDGDVLVCRSTTPPWTPYFGVIGALVTNAGGALSHGAVVAREFGIPAVVGTQRGTIAIPDGATVTVDGTTGLVIIEE